MTAVLLLAARIAVLLGTALVVSRLLRRQAAALRHLVLLTALCLTVVLPVASLMLRGWFDVLPAIPSHHAMTAVASVSGAGGPAPQGAALPAVPAAVEPQGFTSWWLVSVWVGGSVLALLRLAGSMRTLTQLRRDSPPLDEGRWASLLAEVRGDIEVTRDVTLRLAPAHSPLVSWGWTRPQILVPATALSWDRSHVRSVLYHELAHVARHDWARFVGMELIRTLYWWHPVVWLAVREARLLAEHACDDVVIAHQVAPAAYAGQLVALARDSATTHALVTAIASPSSLERRITAMLNPAIRRAPVRGLARTLAITPLLGLTALLAGTSAQAADTGTLVAVVRPDGGHPLPDVEVVLTAAGQPEMRARTDANGTMSLDLPAGTYTAVVQVPGFRRLEARVDVEAGARAERDFALSLGSLTETVAVSGETDPGAVPIALGGGRSPRQVGVVGVPRRIDDGKAPAYPAALREAGIEGAVRATGRVAPDGYVTDIVIVESPHAGLSAIVTEYMAGMRYEPTTVQGTAVSTTLEFTMDFRAQR